MKPEYYDMILKRYAFQELDDIYGAVGYGAIASAYVVGRLLDEQRKDEAQSIPKVVETTPQELQKQLGKATHGVYVKGETGILVRFAKCCNPVPGDEIIGYITRGRGVSVHRNDCVNMGDFAREPERLIQVSWQGEEGTNYNADIQIIAYDNRKQYSFFTAPFFDKCMCIHFVSERVVEQYGICRPESRMGFEGGEYFSRL